MKNLSRIACTFVATMALVLAFALCGCVVNVNITQPSNSSAQTSSVSSASSTSSTSSESSTSSASSTSPASPDNGSSSASSASSSSSSTSAQVTEDGQYTDKEHVALYIHTYGHLPSNYISKTKARKAGWVNTKGNLADVLPGMSIGGSEYYNDDGQLPDAKGRRWTECDIDYNGGYRNEKRIVFSNDGLVFYTGDHYKTFEQLY